jgi:hypothetical protein
MHIIQYFQVSNIQDNEVAKQCLPNSNDVSFGEEDNPEDIPKRKAWHGIKVERNHTAHMILIQTSFSDELVLDTKQRHFSNKNEKLYTFH